MAYESKKLNTAHEVLICGSYGHNNAGDEAVLEAILECFENSSVKTHITVMSRTPEQTQKRHGVDTIYKFNIWAMLGKMCRAKLYINGGGSLIQDVTSRRSLCYYLFTIFMAKVLGCRVIMYGCGIGPVTRFGDRAITKFVVNNFADTITLREADSLHELREYGIKKPKMIVSSDPALCLSPAPEADVIAEMNSLGLDIDGKYLCIVPRKWKGFAERAEHFAKCADYISEKYGLETVFLSIDHKNDAVAAEMIAEHMKTKYHIAYDVIPSRLTIAMLAKMQAVISMRLHGLVFSAGQAVPLVGVSYDPKVSAFFHHLGEDSFIELTSLTADKLINLTEFALSLWDNEEKLADRVKQLRDIESQNLKSALELLGQ